MAQEGVQAGFVRHLACGSIQVKSLDLSTHLQLDAHHLRVNVSYPLLIAAEPTSQTYTYIQHAQHFPVSNVPSRWQPALRLALAAKHPPTASPLPATANPSAARNTSKPSQQEAQQQTPCLGMAASCGELEHQAMPRADDSMPALCQAAGQQFQGSQPCQRGNSLAMPSWRTAEGLQDVGSEICHWPDPGSPLPHGNPGHQPLRSFSSDTRQPARRPATGDPALGPYGMEVASGVHQLSVDACSCTPLPVSGSLGDGDTETLAFAELPWWKCSSAVVSPTGPSIQMEQSSEALYHCLPHCGEVHAWVCPHVHVSPSFCLCVNLTGMWLQSIQSHDGHQQLMANLDAHVSQFMLHMPQLEAEACTTANKLKLQHRLGHV